VSDRDATAITGPWETLDVTVDEHVLVVRFNRPERLNALNPTMSKELEALWTLYDRASGLRVAIVTGAGERAFHAGADVAAVADLSRRRTSDHDRENRFSPLMVGVSKPVIAAVNGVCAGAGLHFVVDSDFAIAGESATFTDTHVSVGQVSALEPIGMARFMPLGAVMRMVLLGRGERLSAQRAMDLGLITEVVPDDRLMDRALELARIVASNSPTAIAISRKAILESFERPHLDAMRYGFVLLRSHADHHPDAQEGPRAFFEKREPKWSDGRAD
jgi:enoyl-CoA hydratase/carnithine racemase